MTALDPTAEIPAQYDPEGTERELYRRWQEAGIFTARAERSRRTGGDRDPFVILMPPPNVTAILHVGHGLNNTVQDVLTRWRRMAGDEALWLPGTDHAGIATQNVVEKALAAEGRTRYDLGREAFEERTARFVEETGGQILDQLRAIGASADWSRTAYTLAPGLSAAVREAFVRLFEDGLIYRGHRVIHWCPRCLTSLSDEEAEFEDTPGKLYHIAYPLAGDASRSLSIATTRPETMLGDVAVAVHPDDERYRDLIGRSLVLPIIGVEIPIVADSYVDPAFGTGVVKITPAHDPNDFEMGRRHGLPMPVVMTPEATMRDGADSAGRVPEALRGMDRFEAREAIVKMLREQGRLVKVESHQHAVRHCYRCDTVVEPRLSDQWFVKMEPLARPALEAARSGAVRILPERWEAVYVNWLEGIRDWNISRQLWWGHRIPVWYCEKDGSAHASRTDLTACPDCGGPVRRDEDVLDTWFSSWLWPISTLGWPEPTATDLKAFYPTDVLITAPEILFFWVARMIMAGFYFKGETPFHSVYLHGTVRDTQHRKMSKSLGNGIDPLEVVKLYGADALRYTLISGMGMGADVILDPKDLERSFATGRNFATKLWNIGRFLLQNVGQDPVTPLDRVDPSRLTRADRWVLARLDAAIADCDAALGPARPSRDARWEERERYVGLRLNEYTEAARRFVWSELADWYVEAIKARLAGDDRDDREVARAVAVHAFDMSLRLLHPVMPFITEALWQRLPGHEEGTFIAVAEWPRAARWRDAASDEFEVVREAVAALRQIRSDYNVAPAKQVDAVLTAHSGAARVLGEERGLIGRLARAAVTVGAAPDAPAAQKVLAGGSEAHVLLAGIVDLEKECKRAKDELANLEKQLGGLRGRLSNESFLARAKPEVVEAERQKEREWGARREQLARKVESLCGE